MSDQTEKLPWHCSDPASPSEASAVTHSSHSFPPQASRQSCRAGRDVARLFLLLSHTGLSTVKDPGMLYGRQDALPALALSTAGCRLEGTGIGKKDTQL